MPRYLLNWPRAHRPGASSRRPRPAPRVRQTRPTLEELEGRLTPSVVSLSTSPRPIPLGNIRAGQTVQLTVTFDTSDIPGDFNGQEQEPVVLESSGGFSEVVADYGATPVLFTASEDGETLTGRIDGFDSDETATVEVSPTAEI